MRVNKLICDICGKEIIGDASTIHFEFTENHFYCEDDLSVKQEMKHYDICQECMYNYENLLDLHEIAYTLCKRIKMAKETYNLL